MKVCGFTIVRNAIKYSYPVVESIKSILPICDKIVVAVGNSDDGTLELIKSIHPDKITIVETVWDDTLRAGGQVLAVETNKTLDAIAEDFDWCFYIQADEVVHEKYLPIIRNEMERWLNHPKVEGLLFKYLHFWGTFDFVGVSRKWYRREIRIVRNDKRIRSFRDAQGFRKEDRKLNVKLIDAYVYHYGWVRPPEVIKNKMRSFHALYHSDTALEEKVTEVADFDYSEIDAVKRFNDTHPKIMGDLVKNLNWHVQLDESKIKFNFKGYILFWIEKLFGYRLFEYKNYKIIP
ncbi:MAG: glycosyltransferase family 2 protein [Bacteroidales bacterium]|nr:glycosyltransferase family 2 protein [Bacteroidales bacterium]